MEAKTAEKLRKLEERRIAYNEARKMKRREETEKQRAFAKAVEKGLALPRRTGRQRKTKNVNLKEADLKRNNSFGGSKKRTRKKK
jgi:hypothetical protein